MFQNKLMNMALIILIAITLLGSTSFVLYQYFLQDSKQAITADVKPEKLSADDILKRTVETKEIRTNLADDKYILVKFVFQLDTIDAREELQKREFQLNSIIVSVLASTTSEEIRGEEGIKRLETMLLNRVNDILEEGKVIKVYTTDKILQ